MNRVRTSIVSYGGLVRGDDGSLHVRSFPTGELANAASQASGRDFVIRAADRRNLGSPAELSARLGGTPSAATITRLCKRGDLPCRNDGAGEKLPRYRLPIRAIVASVMNGGLRATIARHRAGFFGSV